MGRKPLVTPRDVLRDSAWAKSADQMQEDIHLMTDKLKLHWVPERLFRRDPYSALWQWDNKRKTWTLRGPNNLWLKVTALSFARTRTGTPWVVSFGRSQWRIGWLHSYAEAVWSEDADDVAEMLLVTITEARHALENLHWLRERITRLHLFRSHRDCKAHFRSEMQARTAAEEFLGALLADRLGSLPEWGLWPISRYTNDWHHWSDWRECLRRSVPAARVSARPFRLSREPEVVGDVGGLTPNRYAWFKGQIRAGYCRMSYHHPNPRKAALFLPHDPETTRTVREVDPGHTAKLIQWLNAEGAALLGKASPHMERVWRLPGGNYVGEETGLPLYARHDGRLAYDPEPDWDDEWDNSDEDAGYDPDDLDDL